LSRSSRQQPKASSRRLSTNLGRSTSRVSNGSGHNQARRRERNLHGHSPEDSPDEEEDESDSLFKFSSTSSIDNDHVSTSTHDLAKKNRRNFSKKNSLTSGSQIQSPKLPSLPKYYQGRSPSRNSSVTNDQQNHHQVLVRKLELMHNFTTEAVKLLKKEAIKDDHDEGGVLDESSNLFRALEENHEELRQLLLIRLRSRHKSSIIIAPPGSDHGGKESPPNVENVDTNNTITADMGDEEDKESLEEEPTVRYNDNSSMHEETAYPTIEEDAKDSPIEVSNEQETPFDLATIEEQPELGYQTDSYQSDSEAYENIHSKFNPENLSTVTEETKAQLKE
jgi:hypothetical protein